MIRIPVHSGAVGVSPSVVGGLVLVQVDDIIAQARAVMTIEQARGFAEDIAEAIVDAEARLAHDSRFAPPNSRVEEDGA